jgi:hypothetical protein
VHLYPRGTRSAPVNTLRALVLRVPLVSPPLAFPYEPRRSLTSSRLSTNDQSVPREHLEYLNLSTMRTPI